MVSKIVSLSLVIIISLIYPVNAQRTRKDLTPLPKKNTMKKLTSFEAGEKAAHFLRDIGQYCGSPEKISVVNEHSTLHSNSSDASVWRVVFSGGPWIDLSTDTGAIVSYSYGPIMSNIEEAGKSPAGTMLSRSEAIDRSASIISHLAISEHLIVEAADLEQEGEDFGDSAWVIDWRRYNKDVPYFSDGIRISLEAETGQVTNIDVKMPLYKQILNVKSVDEEDAKVVASTFLKAKNITPTKLIPRLYYSNSTDYLSSTSQVGVSYLSWYIVAVEDRGAKSAIWKIWIDATNGKVLAAWVDLITPK